MHNNNDVQIVMLSATIYKLIKQHVLLQIAAAIK